MQPTAQRRWSSSADADFTIFDEPDGADPYYLTVDAPLPADDARSGWGVHIGRWNTDFDDPERGVSGATGSRPDTNEDRQTAA
jgi:hypothetical protein